MVSWLPTALNWRVRTPFYYGWLILAMAFVSAFAATGVTQVVVGGVQIFITEDTGWEPTTISLAVTSGTWLSGLFAPFLGRLADRYGPLQPIEDEMSPASCAGGLRGPRFGDRNVAPLCFAA